MVVAPNVGDDVYVQSAFYIDHGEDDRVGGLAKVVKVTEGVSGGKPCYYIMVEPFPGVSMNWDLLAEKQDELWGEFGNKRAYADPDLG